MNVAVPHPRAARRGTVARFRPPTAVAGHWSVALVVCALLGAGPGCALFWGGVSAALDDAESAALLTILPPAAEAPGESSTDPAPEEETAGGLAANERWIFATTARINGDIDSSLNLPGDDILTGLDDADYYCNQDAARPDASLTYAALLTDGGHTREATTTANCGATTGGNPGGNCTGRKDWILAANTRYLRADRTLVFRTNADAIAPAFETDLWGAPLGGGVRVWTGFDSDWTSVDDCAQWDDSSSDGAFGEPDSSGMSGIAAGGVSCSWSYALLCVSVE